jgi:hypothetical protein
MHMDTLQVKKKYEVVERSLAIFFSKFTERYPRYEFPLNIVEVCEISENLLKPTNFLLCQV